MLHNLLTQLVIKHQDKTMWLASQLPPLSCYGADHSAQSVIEVSCFHIFWMICWSSIVWCILCFQAVFIFI